MIRRLFAIISILILTSTFVIGIYLLNLYDDLPNVSSLRDIQLQVPLRIFSADGKLMAEYGEKRRIPLDIEEVPQTFINAVLATEDRRFYQHVGVDFRGLARAAVNLITEGRKTQGGSTITMQVARNFFLSRKKTFTRKLNEILLAIKIERGMSKNEILALYLNKVFFGYRAYGAAAAAEVYYGKPLQDLTLAQYAMIAGIPKAPSAINPIANKNAALKRRTHVLNKMREIGLITEAQYQVAVTSPITASYHGTTLELRAPYVAEMVRQELYRYIGEDAYNQGFQVYTTIDSSLQNYANSALRKGLLAYDKRHGMRPLKSAGNNINTWPKQLKTQKRYANLIPGIVSQIQEQSINVQLPDERIVTIEWNSLQWARLQHRSGNLGPKPKLAKDIVKIGDIVYVSAEKHGYALSQLPEVEGALVAMAPEDGRILALTGGFDFNHSKFNRVTQAQLQPGSNFKPFIYSAALDQGFTAASIINDAPITLTDPSEEALWRPENANNRFNGPTSLRMGLIRSRNLVSIRLLRQIGIPYAISYLKRFGFDADKMPKGLSLALGTAMVNPLEIVRGYAILANGGAKIEPHFISRIENSNGETIYAASPLQACHACQNKAPVAIDPRNAYIMTNLLQDAIKRGTGRAARVLGRQDIAGKTGTTNEQVDAWFSGYNTSIATTVWVGFDTPHTLKEYASKAALPIWIDFMRQALKGRPDITPTPPPGLVTIKIDPKTGLLARGRQRNAIFELFREEEVPKQHSSNGAHPTNKSNAAPERIF